MSFTELLEVRAITPALALALSDDDLLAEQREFAAAQRLIAAGSAVLAAEIARRSHPDFGYSGLAQSRGARNPEILVQQITGLSGADARKLVRVGAMVSEPTPWMTAVSAAVSSGDLSLDAADAIRAGLGEPGRVAADDLIDAATRLVREAPGLTLEQLAARARGARTELDLAGVPEREEERRARRYLSLTPLPNGDVRIAGIADPESAAILCGAVDAATSPRRGGPRFEDPASAPETLVDDSRTIPQLMLDALVDLVKLAALADSGKVLGKRRVGVRVHVAERDLRSGEGFAHLEGQSAVVSVATAERIACDSGIVPILFDEGGQVVNVGREQRLHTPRMRQAIAARDGGCVVPGCARPPEWCEVHHINEWVRDNGETSIEDGVLMCRHHHMLLHNNGWRIKRDHAQYNMISPRGEVTALTPKNPILGRLKRLGRPERPERLKRPESATTRSATQTS